MKLESIIYGTETYEIAMEIAYIKAENVLRHSANKIKRSKMRVCENKIVRFLPHNFFLVKKKK